MCSASFLCDLRQFSNGPMKQNLEDNTPNLILTIGMDLSIWQRTPEEKLLRKP